MQLDKKQQGRNITTFKREVYLKDNISRTAFGGGILIKSEFVKNSSLRLASRFLGMFEAESLIVNREYNLLTCALCMRSTLIKFIDKYTETTK